MKGKELHVILYRYTSKEKIDALNQAKFLKPTSPFNPKIRNKEWEEYIKRFPFPVSKKYICAFLEPFPSSWVEYGLFYLLMEEFSSGDFLLRISTEDDPDNPILVRDHKHHSPKEYELRPKFWRERKNRESRPDLRKKWIESAVPLSKYDGSYICPEILIPFPVEMNQIQIEPQ